MELSKKTTILFSPDTHARLTALAARRGTSLGDLVREACVAQYGHPCGRGGGAHGAVAAGGVPARHEAGIRAERPLADAARKIAQNAVTTT
jgi:hypothetical protein